MKIVNDLITLRCNRMLPVISFTDFGSYILYDQLLISPIVYRMPVLNNINKFLDERSK